MTYFPEPEQKLAAAMTRSNPRTEFTLVVRQARAKLTYIDGCIDRVVDQTGRRPQQNDVASTQQLCAKLAEVEELLDSVLRTKRA